MLVQIELHGQRIKVYVETKQGDLFTHLSREDKEYARTKITQCVVGLVNKFHNEYRKRS